MSPITVVMLNYRRPANVPRIVDALLRQTVTPTIWLWNNAGASVADPRVHAEIVSGRNLRCWARWFFATYAETPYVMFIDDDLVPVHDRFVAAAVDAIKRETILEAIVGAEGVVFGEGGKYWPSYPGRIARHVADEALGTVHLRKVAADLRVDVVKGRCMIVRTEALCALPLAPPHRDMCDDIAVSALLARGRRRMHLVSAALGAALDDIPDVDPDVALSDQPAWREIRDAAKAHYWNEAISSP